MSDARQLYVQGWCNGFDRAVELFRDWAREFGDQRAQQTINAAADMVQATKPTNEELT